MFVHKFGVDTIGIRAAKLGGKQINLRAIVHAKSVVCSSNEIEANLQAGPDTIIRPVSFYFYDESEPSLVIFARSVFILPTSQNRHSSSFGEEG